jgi:hypothetical protein
MESQALAQVTAVTVALNSSPRPLVLAAQRGTPEETVLALAQAAAALEAAVLPVATVQAVLITPTTPVAAGAAATPPAEEPVVAAVELAQCPEEPAMAPGVPAAEMRTRAAPWGLVMEGVEADSPQEAAGVEALGAAVRPSLLRHPRSVA